MKKIIKLSLLAVLLTGSVSASTAQVNDEVLASDFTTNANLRLYGLGLNIGYPNDNTLGDESYSGLGIEFENDFSRATLEYGSDYKVGSLIYKHDITNLVYVKGGLGLLQREMSILGARKDVRQFTGGLSLGLGDTKSYNLELGYLDSKLSDAANADGHSKISYVEAVAKHSFGSYLTFDVVGLVQNTNVFNKNYSDSQAEFAWYPMADARAFINHNTKEQDKDNYTVHVGLQYVFGSGEVGPYFKASRSTNENVSVGIEYYAGLGNKSLQMRDYFEKAVKTTTIVAQVAAPEAFSEKTKEEATPTTTAAPADTEAPVLTSTLRGPTGSTGSRIEDYAALVSDNVTSDANMGIVITSPAAGITVTNVGTTVTFTGLTGASVSGVKFKFVDEAGNQSAEFTQFILIN